MRNALLILLGTALAGCPLPYQYTRAGWVGNASTVDPSTPSISGIPRITYTQSSGSGGTIVTGGTATTSSDTMITLVSDTTGAVIYYTTDGTTPDPRSSQTSRFNPGSPILLSVPSPSPTDSSASISLKAAAIGPNMKPSPVMSAGVTVQYPQAAAPVFSPAGGSYTTDQSLVMTSATPGAVIYYTLVNGPGPAPAPVPGQAGTLQYSGPVTLTGPASSYTISAIATVSQMIASAQASASYSIFYPGLATPTFNPPAGTYSNDQTVTVTSGAGSTIWYTTDGSAPAVGTSPSIPSGGAITLTGGAPGTGVASVHALATQTGFADSPSVTASYLFQAAAPVPSPGGGTFFNDLTGVAGVFMGTVTNGAAIYYTTDGSTPTTSSTQYTGAIQITASTTVKAIAARADYLNSTVTSNTYTLQAAVPAFSAAGGTYSSALSVSITETTSGASVYYTTDGSTPTTSSTLYGGSISMPNGLATQLSAIAVKPNYLTSGVDTVTYVVLVPPSGLALGVASGTTMSASWSAVPAGPLSNYVLVRGTEPTFTVSPQTMTVAGTSFTDSGLSPSSQYYYEVKAAYTGGSSTYSGSQQGYTLSLTGDPSVVNQDISSYTPPSTYGSYYYVSGTSFATTPTGPVLREGGFTFVPYGKDTNNDIQVVLVCFNSSGAEVNQWTIPGTRYVWSMTESLGIVTIVGQSNVAVTIPWATIKQ